jgi:DNA-binding LytR/AlgR family response regulator
MYDIVFIDIRLPEINGLGSCRKLRDTDPYLVVCFVSVTHEFYDDSGSEFSSIGLRPTF